MNTYEENLIKNSDLPESWKAQSSLDDLERFLQLNWEQRFSFYNDEKQYSNQQFIEFKNNKSIRTNNYIGTISFNGEILNIFPKVFKTNKDDKEIPDLDVAYLMKNLVIWIEYCNKVDYPYINMNCDLNNSNSLEELFITIFIKYLSNAISRSSYHQYVEKEEDISTIRGHLNIKDYYTNKYGKGNLDRFLCTYSEFEFDNLLNRIIKFTCKLLLKKTSIKNEQQLRRIIARFSEVTDVNCFPSDCDKIKLGKMYNHYKIILSMCKIFLLNKVSSYDIGQSDTYCFLFPTEYLFEGFICGYIASTLENEANVKYQASDMYLFDDVIYGKESLGKSMLMRHDILVEHKTKGLFILDTKYKELHRFEKSDIKKQISEEINTGDLYQVYTYASKRGINDVYLLYPLYRCEKLEPIDPIGIACSLDGRIIRIHFIRIPCVFDEDVKLTKNMLTEEINRIFLFI